MIKVNLDAVAVDHNYYWQPMSSCPRGADIQLLNVGGVAVRGKYDGKDKDWQGWAAFPKKRKPEGTK